MPGFNGPTEDEDDLYDAVAAMADRLKLEGESRQSYIHDHMVQGGYEPVQSRESYRRIQQDEEETSQGSGSRWGFGGNRPGGTRPPARGNQDDGDRFGR